MAVSAEATITRLPPLLSDLVFNYIVCARSYGMAGDKAGETNQKEEDLAIELLLNVFNSFGYSFTREHLLADVEART